LYIFEIFIFIKKINKNNLFYWDNYKYFEEHVAKKNPSKNPFYEKVKMFQKGPFVVESFGPIGSFNYDCTHLDIIIISMMVNICMIIFTKV
jgi:hypothetical protein